MNHGIVYLHVNTRLVAFVVDKIDLICIFLGKIIRGVNVGGGGGGGVVHPQTYVSVGL